jgi:hypothetical protein
VQYTEDITLPCAKTQKISRCSSYTHVNDFTSETTVEDFKALLDAGISEEGNYTKVSMALCAKSDRNHLCEIHRSVATLGAHSLIERRSSFQALEEIVCEAFLIDAYTLTNNRVAEEVTPPPGPILVNPMTQTRNISDSGTFFAHAPG